MVFIKEWEKRSTRKLWTVSSPVPRHKSPGGSGFCARSSVFKVQSVNKYAFTL